MENPNTEDVTAIRILKILLHKQKNGIDTIVAWTPGRVGIRGGGDEVAHSLATSNTGVLPNHLQPFLRASSQFVGHPYANLSSSAYFEMARLRRFLKHINRERFKDVTPPRIFQNFTLTQFKETLINN